MAKPTTVPVWESNGTNETPAPVAYQTDGWGGTTRKLANSKYMNWFMRWVYLWCSWLNGLFDGSGNLTLDVNASVTVSGTGKHKRPARSRKFSALLGQSYGGGASFPGTGSGANGQWQGTLANDFLIVPITVDEGETITTVKVYIEGDSTGFAVAFLNAQDGGGSGFSAVSTGAGSVASSTPQTLVINTTTGGGSALAELVSAGSRSYQVSVLLSGTFAQAIYVATVEVITAVL